MPIYEFYCPDNGTIYSFLARSLAHAGKTPRCPANPAFKMERMISKFAVTGRAREKSAPGGENMAPDDPRMEAVMAEMEREFAGMDENHLDPCALARMMRRMAEVTGEKMPAGAEEMIARMERGEDPEKLEAEYGDILDAPGSEPMSADNPAGGKLRAALRRLRDQPRRDSTLYDMGEFVD